MKHIVTIEVLKSKNPVASLSGGLAGGQACVLRGQVGGQAVQSLGSSYRKGIYCNFIMRGDRDAS